MAHWVKAQLENNPATYINLDLLRYVTIVPGGEPLEWYVRCEIGHLGVHATEEEAQQALDELMRA